LDEDGVPTQRVRQTVSKSCQTAEAKVYWGKYFAASTAGLGFR
jgi:hypothetical protein